MAVISYKCPNCDGELIFDPNTQQYKCEYCNSMFTQEEVDAMDKAQSTEQKDTTKEEENAQRGAEMGAGAGVDGADATDHTANPEADNEAQAAGKETRDAGKETQEQGAGSEEEAVIYSCPSCGAEIVTDATTAATFCYYCHNPVVLGGRLEGKYLPHKVIPFKMDRKKAEATFLEAVSKKKFVPRGFFSKKNIEKLSGVYFPYWLYSVNLDGEVQGEGKKIRTWVAGDEEFTETKIYELYREGNVQLDNLPENALKKANSKLAEGVLPYKFDEMKEFNMGYLSGFMAEKRDIETQEVQQEMQQEMRKSAERIFRDTMTDCGIVSVKNANFRALKEDWQYVLLPVWTLTYKANNGKIYYYSMNGQTGKLCGELPIDWKKVFLTAAGIFAVLFGFGLLGGLLIW